MSILIPTVGVPILADNWGAGGEFGKGSGMLVEMEFIGFAPFLEFGLSRCAVKGFLGRETRKVATHAAVEKELVWGES